MFVYMYTCKTVDLLYTAFYTVVYWNILDIQLCLFICIHVKQLTYCIQHSTLWYIGMYWIFSYVCLYVYM